MSVEEAAHRLRSLLDAVGFDATQPSPALAWEAFKQFAPEPVDVLTTELWFECADGGPAGNPPAYFDFVRMFMHYPDDAAGWGEQITAHFSAPPSVQLGLRPGSIQASDIANLQACRGRRSVPIVRCRTCLRWLVLRGPNRRMLKANFSWIRLEWEMILAP